MNKLSAVLVAVMFGLSSVSVYAADPVSKDAAKTEAKADAKADKAKAAKAKASKARASKAKAAKAKAAKAKARADANDSTKMVPYQSSPSPGRSRQ